MELVITAEAQKQLSGIPKADAARLQSAMEEIARTYPQRMSYVTELKGGGWRARKGNYRAIFEVDGRVVRVLAVGHRKDIYE